MVNYQNGKIYKIVCDDSENIYIGSTTKEKLSQRMAKHKSHHNDYLDGKGRFISSFIMLEKQNPRIILIENYPCNNKDELRMREQYWIDQFRNICINKINANGINIDKKKGWLDNYRKTDNFKAYASKYRTSDKYRIHQNKYQKTEVPKKWQIEYEKTDKRKQYKKQTRICLFCGKKSTNGDLSRHQKSNYCKSFQINTCTTN
jgi:hypothetical protein